jgi:hypothetical protein
VYSSHRTPGHEKRVLLAWKISLAIPTKLTCTTPSQSLKRLVENSQGANWNTNPSQSLKRRVVKIIEAQIEQQKGHRATLAEDSSNHRSKSRKKHESRTYDETQDWTAKKTESNTGRDAQNKRNCTQVAEPKIDIRARELDVRKYENRTCDARKFWKAKRTESNAGRDAQNKRNCTQVAEPKIDIRARELDVRKY